MDQARLKELLHYCPDTGVFTWRSRRRGVTVGSSAGHLSRYGYLAVTLDHKRYLVHRLVWLYVYGAWPAECVDHINRVRTDNRLCNLRTATRAQNRQNLSLTSRNSSGFRGVSFDKKNNKWRASISVNGKAKNLGRFVVLSDAKVAYAKAAAVFHTHNMEAA